MPLTEGDLDAIAKRLREDRDAEARERDRDREIRGAARGAAHYSAADPVATRRERLERERGRASVEDRAL